MVDYLVYLTISAATFALFALGLNVQWGLTGLINFGHVAFMTVGAYGAILLSMQGVPLLASVAIGAGLAALLGLLVGTTALRLREDYLAIVTIGISELLRQIALNEEWLTQGALGLQQFPLPLADYQPGPWGKGAAIAVLTLLALIAVAALWRGIRQQQRQRQARQQRSWDLLLWGAAATLLGGTLYTSGAIALANYDYKAGLMLLVLVVLALVYAGVGRLAQSPWGRVLKSIREDEQVPRALGKDIFGYKLQAFMLGSAIAGVAGAFYAWQLTAVYPQNFDPLISFYAWTIVILGGSGRNAGVLLGAVLFWGYNSLTRFVLPDLLPLDDARVSALRIMAIGAILMGLMVWRPQGVLGSKEELTLGR